MGFDLCNAPASAEPTPRLVVRPAGDLEMLHSIGSAGACFKIAFVRKSFSLSRKAMAVSLYHTGVARLRVSLPLAFWGLRPLRVLRPPRDAEARLLPLWSERPKRLRLRQPYWPALGLRVSLMLAFWRLLCDTPTQAADARLRSRCIMNEDQKQLVYEPSAWEN